MKLKPDPEAAVVADEADSVEEQGKTGSKRMSKQLVEGGQTSYAVDSNGND